MWINGLKILQKPMLHLHTQFNRELPYDEIDMDFMNLNQSAHGDREFSYVLTRLNIPRVSVAGYYQDEDIINEISEWIDVAIGVDCSKKVKVCRFGDNMREVAVTDGDKVEAQIKLGWQIDYYGIGDIVQEINKVTESETDALYNEITSKYDLNTNDIDAVKEQVKYEIALKRFLDKNNYTALTTNFQDLHGLKQLFGMSIQRLMAEGYGFGAEGDWKIAALGRAFKKMAEGRKGATFFGIAACVTHIVGCILSGVEIALTLSTAQHGEYEGVEDVCLSTLALLGRNGICGRVMVPLTDSELASLQASAAKLKEVIASVEI